MAGYVGNNYGIQQPREGATSNNRLILKEELRRQWYVYTTTADTEFRPYPVFDAQGNACPPMGNPDSEREVDILPESFAALRVATFAGLQKNLEFIDMCADIQNYNTEGVGYLKTPYEYLVLALQRMSPRKNDRTKTGDGYPMPKQLEPIANPYGVPNSASCIVVRGALTKHKGQPITTQAAVGGMLPTAVILIKQQGAIASLYKMLKTPRDVIQPISPVNSVLYSMFSLQGTTLGVTTSPSQDGKANTSYDLTQTFDQSFAVRLSQALQAPLSDDASYWNALRALFGPYQSVGDIFNVMTVDKMVSVLKDNYPISWLWYAWKDSPYASLVTAEEKKAALSDPEMASRFGVDAATPQVSTQLNQPWDKPAVTPPYPAPAPAPYSAPAAPATAPGQPSWNSPTYGGEQPGGIQQPSVGQLPPAYPGSLNGGGGSVQPQAVTNDAMAALEAKYSNGGDGIKY